MNKIETIGTYYGISRCMFIICFLGLVYLLVFSVGHQYYIQWRREQWWMINEKIAYFLFLYVAAISFLVVFWIGLYYMFLNQTTSTDDDDDIAPQLFELNEIVYP